MVQPSEMYVCLPYKLSYNYLISTTGTLNNVFSANGPFDPDVSGVGGNSAKGFTAWAYLYDYIESYKSSIEMEILNYDCTNPLTVTLFTSESSTFVYTYPE